MKFKKFINESIKELSKESFILELNKNCSQNWKIIKNYPLYKGFLKNLSNEFILFNSNDWNRKSSDGSNYMNIIFSEILTSWKNYPKRNKSIICTNSLKTAKKYTNSENEQIYIIIPFDNTKTFTATFYDDDFIESFPELSRKLHLEYNIYDLNEIFKYLNISDNLNDTKNFLNLTVNSIQNKYNNYNFKYEHRKQEFTNFLDNLLKHYKKDDKLIQIFEEIFHPEKNKFEKLNNIPILNHDSEIWFEGKCLTIKKSIFNEIKNEI